MIAKMSSMPGSDTLMLAISGGEGQEEFKVKRAMKIRRSYGYL